MSQTPACTTSPLQLLDVDPWSRDGFTIAVCEEHLDAAYGYYATMGQTLAANDAAPSEYEITSCSFEADWDDPDAALRAQVLTFLEHSPDAALALGGDCDALVRLLLDHAAGYRVRSIV